MYNEIKYRLWENMRERRRYIQRVLEWTYKMDKTIVGSRKDCDNS